MPEPLGLYLPAGTQIVTRIAILGDAGETICPRGAVGVISATPPDGGVVYRVRFPTGVEASLDRQEFSVRKHDRGRALRAASLSGVADEHDELTQYIIYRCVVGSRAYGLDVETSDTDRRGVYLPPADRQWSLWGVPEQLENDAAQECYWELQKFLNLALKANPNALECLYTPLVEEATPLAREMLANRGRFLSRLVYQTYNGYVLSQFKKLEQDRRTRGEIRPKHAMHLIRLLLSGITILKKGNVPINVQQHRDQLLAIREGVLLWEAVDAWRVQLHQDLDAAFTRTRLPERPDYAWANQFLIVARRSMVEVGRDKSEVHG
jgi:uncharacterized protein